MPKKQFYETTHRKTSDPKYSHDHASVRVYECATCNKEQSVYSGETAPFCNTCQKYMVHKSTIQSEKVDEIRNRKIDYSKPQDVKSGNIVDLWDQGLIPTHIGGRIYPVSGGQPIDVIGNYSKHSFEHKLVAFKIGDKVVEIRLADLGRVLDGFI